MMSTCITCCRAHYTELDAATCTHEPPQGTTPPPTATCFRCGGECYPHNEYAAGYHACPICDAEMVREGEIDAARDAELWAEDARKMEEEAADFWA